jgi:hypothetical protein
MLPVGKDMETLFFYTKKCIPCILVDMQARGVSVNATPYVLNYQPFGTLKAHVRSHSYKNGVAVQEVMDM